jgi:hypothetical protein
MGMSTFSAEDTSLASLILLEELLQTLAKSNSLPEGQIADVVRGANARM